MLVNLGKLSDILKQVILKLIVVYWGLILEGG